MRKMNNEVYLIKRDELNVVRRNGSRLRCTCPVCSDTRGNPKDPSLAFDTQTGVGFCHHCRAKFKEVTGDVTEQDMPQEETEDDTPPDFSASLSPLDDECRRYLMLRSISTATALGAGICSSTRNGRHRVAFPFTENGRVVNVQYKLADTEHKEFCFEQGGRMIPWNARCLADGEAHGELFVTEGMMDALALMECGVRYVVSVPNGANSRMDCFDGYAAMIRRRFSSIVFAGDTDDKGLVLRNSVSDYFRSMPVGCVAWRWHDVNAKDADEMLMKGGKDAVRWCLENVHYEGTKHLMVAGTDDSALDRLYAEGMPEGNGIGLRGFDELVHFLPGYMYIISGYPSTGKSSLVNYITMSLLRLFDWPVLFFSPEKMPEANHMTELVSVVTGHRFDRSCLRSEVFEMAKHYLSGRVLHIDDEVSSLNELLEIAAKAVMLHHIKVMVIDPFMYLEADDIRGMSETSKIGCMLKRIRQFMKHYEVMILLVAHPRKPTNDSNAKAIPQLYEIGGSSNFFNVCDSGIFLERCAEGSCRVRVTCGKARFGYLGQTGTREIVYDTYSGRYAGVMQPGNVIDDTDRSDWTRERTGNYADVLDYYEKGGDAPF